MFFFFFFFCGRLLLYAYNVIRHDAFNGGTLYLSYFEFAESIVTDINSCG